MPGLTSLGLSIVNVPLYDAPYAIPIGSSFDMASYGPMLAINGQTQGASPTLSAVDAEMPMVGGLSTYIIGVHNAPGFSTGGPVTYFDGVLHYMGDASGGFPPRQVSGGSFFTTAYKPRPLVNIPGKNFWSLVTDTFQATNKGYIGAMWPGKYRGKNAALVPYGTQNLFEQGVVMLYQNAFQQGGPYAGDPGPSLFNIPLWKRIGGNTNGGNLAFNRMTPGAQSQLSFNMSMDNIGVVTPSFTFATEPAQVAWMSSIFPDKSITQEWHLDNPVLENLWTNAGAAHVPFIKPFPYGILVTLFANGAGPTGQKYEYLVFNSDVTSYYLIKFLPQDANSTTQINSGTLTMIAIDEQGIVWVNGLSPNSRVSSSFSPTGQFFPVIQAPPLNPFVLPCYNTCSPVTLLH